MVAAILPAHAEGLAAKQECCESPRSFFMRRTWRAAVCVLLIVLLAPVVRAGEKRADAPTVVVRVKSINALLQNLNLVVKLVGQEEAAHQIEGLVKSKIGKMGLEGIDPSRPFGAYVRFGKAIDEIKGAILIPMVDEKTFLTLLDNVGVDYIKDKDGIYTHKTNKNVDLYFRFAHQYLYITSVNTESIQNKNLPDPAMALAIPSDATISLVARVDQIPEDAKRIALAQLQEAILAAQRKEQPGETKIQETFRVALLNDFQKLGSSLIREAGEVRFDLNISDKTKEMTVNFAVTGKPGSELAKTLKNVGDLRSPLSGMVKKDLAFQGAVHFALPESLNKAFVNVITEVKENALKGIQDAKKKDQARTLFEAMMPTAKAGDFQIVSAVLGPKAQRYTFLGALKLKGGDKLGKTVYDLLKDASSDLPEDQRSRIQLDFDRVGAIQIHRFVVPKDPKIDKIISEIAGDNHLYLAFRDDALFLALGKEALPTLKTALVNKDSARSQPLVFDFDVGRMALLMAQTQEQKDLAGRLFPNGESKVRLTVEGGANLNAHLQMPLNVLEFLAKLKNKTE
jgi:hypothetical protein